MKFMLWCCSMGLAWLIMNNCIINICVNDVLRLIISERDPNRSKISRMIWQKQPGETERNQIKEMFCNRSRKSFAGSMTQIRDNLWFEFFLKLGNVQSQPVTEEASRESSCELLLEFLSFRLRMLVEESCEAKMTNDDRTSLQEPGSVTVFILFNWLIYS